MSQAKKSSMQKVYNLFYVVFVVLLMFKSTSAYADDNMTQTYIDSVSLYHFELGNWDELINTGKLAEKNDINFKWLQQRVGYAYFNKKQYYKSMQHYEQALAFDEKDEITRLYLYYNGINTGDISYARYHAGKLSEASRVYIEQRGFRPLDAIDLEFSYKIPEAAVINDATYKRFGLNSMLGYQVNLYQSFSSFSQSTDTTQTKQSEYFALIGWNPTAKTNLSLGYHYVYTTVNQSPYTNYYPGNIIFGKISHKLNRIDLSVSGANFNNDWIDTKQLGVHLGIGFSGQNNIYLTSSYYRILETGSDYAYGRNLFKQTAGILLFQRLWTEASINFGNLNHFIDNNGLYIYNSLDPTSFRTGLSLFGYVSKPITVYVNYTFDKKLVVSSNQQYNQHSITGGIIWKI
jgi:hypothetical protein